MSRIFRYMLQPLGQPLSIFFLCLLLSGCASRRASHNLYLWKEQEARLYDIPVMIGAIPDFAYQQEHDGQPSWVAYTVRASLGSVESYYTQNMERYGWRCCGVVHGYENMMVFEKPQRLCMLSLRPTSQGNETKIVITQAFLE